MIEGVTNYPLTWPIGWGRTHFLKRGSARFANHSIATARDYVLDELRLMGARDPVISSNMTLRQDGLPRSSQKPPDDPGVAVYFVLNNKPRVLACDHWHFVEDNLWAIAKHIDALRGQSRWMVGTLDQAFRGYEALPAPGESWWIVLGVVPEIDFTNLRSAYRALVLKNHPDSGGDPNAFIRIQKAYEEACKARGFQ